MTFNITGDETNQNVKNNSLTKIRDQKVRIFSEFIHLIHYRQDLKSIFRTENFSSLYEKSHCASEILFEVLFPVVSL